MPRNRAIPDLGRPIATKGAGGDVRPSFAARGPPAFYVRSIYRWGELERPVKPAPNGHCLEIGTSEPGRRIVNRWRMHE